MTARGIGLLIQNSQKEFELSNKQDSRHCLVNALDAVSHRELVHELFSWWIEVHLPGIITLRLGQRDHTIVLLAQTVKQILVQACVLHVVRSDLLLAFDLHADVQPDRPRNRALVRPLLKVVPHVHLPAQRPHLDDRLTEEIVALPRQFLPQLRLQIVVLVPHSHFYPVGRVMALAVNGRGFRGFHCNYSIQGNCDSSVRIPI